MPSAQPALIDTGSMDRDIAELDGLLGRPRERITATVIWPEDAIEEMLADQRKRDAAHDLLASLKELIEVAEFVADDSEECRAELLCNDTGCAEVGCIIDKMKRARAAIRKAEDHRS